MNIVPTVLLLFLLLFLLLLFFPPFLRLRLCGNILISKHTHELDQPEGQAWFEVTECSLVTNSSVFVPLWLWNKPYLTKRSSPFVRWWNCLFHTGQKHLNTKKYPNPRVIAMLETLKWLGSYLKSCPSIWVLWYFRLFSSFVHIAFFPPWLPKHVEYYHWVTKTTHLDLLAT